MPIMRVELLEGRPPELKQELIRELTETAVRVLQVPPENVRVILYELPREHWGIGGVPVSQMAGR